MSYRSWFPGVSLLVVLASSTASLAQSPPASQPPFRSGIELVLVDVTVLGRDGAPVTALGPDDFTLTVDRRPRRVHSVRRIGTAAADADATPGGLPGVAPSGPRTFVFVIDREHIAVGEGQEMLAAAAGFVDRLAPDDRVVLWTTAQATGSVNFQESRESIAKRIRSAVGTARPSFGPWNVTLAEAFEADARAFGGTFTWVYIDGSSEVFPLSMKPILSRECERQPDSCPRQVRDQVTDTARTARQLAETGLANLRNLLDLLTPLDGPKHVVLVTGGPVMAFEYTDVIQALGAQAALARVTVHALQVRDAGPQARTDQMRPTAEAVDQSQSSAYALAGVTGGLALTPVTGAIAFTRLARELSAGYLLAFEAEPGDRDGRAHEIGVAVRDRGWGTSVRARRTFALDARVAALAPAAIVRVPAAPSPAAQAPPPVLPPPAQAPVPAAPAPAPAPAPKAPSDPAVDEVVRKMAAYVAGYGPQASVIVAVEKYTQQLTVEGQYVRPRNLVAEFAIVKAGGRVGWVGFRDVVEVDGQAVAERRDRLQSLLTGPAGGEAELRRLSDESARYNVGPIIRNFNVPTTALFFFHPDLVGRFTFRRTGTKNIDGVQTWALDFRETQRPTIVRKPDGSSVPCEGTVWVVPGDGTVVRTRLRLRNFADMAYMGGTDRRPTDRVQVGEFTPQPTQTTVQQAPPQTAPPQQGQPSQPGTTPPSGQATSTGGGTATGSTGGEATLVAPARHRRFEDDMTPQIVEIESLVDIEVSYRRDDPSGLWLPSKMSEVYEGPIPRGTRTPVTGRAVGTARYSDFKRFETAVRIVWPM